MSAPCSVPECARDARAKGLCASHHRAQLRGRPLVAIRPGPGRPRGPELRAITTRVGLETWARIEAWARDARYGSAYRVVRDVIATTLEYWGTPELQEQLAALEQPVSAGARRVVVAKGKARRDKRERSNVA